MSYTKNLREAHLLELEKDTMQEEECEMTQEDFAYTWRRTILSCLQSIECANGSIKRGFQVEYNKRVRAAQPKVIRMNIERLHRYGYSHLIPEFNSKLLEL